MTERTRPLDADLIDPRHRFPCQECGRKRRPTDLEYRQTSPEGFGHTVCRGGCTALRRTGPIRRKTAIKRRNARRGARFPRLVDEPYREWIRSLPCCVCGRHPAHIHPHHVRTRGAGGADRGNLVPLCPLDHAELHAVGRRTFAARHSLDLASLAASLDAAYPGETA